MNPWIVVGFVINSVLGVYLLGVDSLGLFKSSTGLHKMILQVDSFALVRVGLACLYGSLLLSFAGIVLLVLNKRKLGAWCLFVGGLCWFPIGLIQSRGAYQLLDEMKQEELAEEWGIPAMNAALESSMKRKPLMVWFDLLFGAFLCVATLVVAYYSLFQHFYRRLPATLPKGIIALQQPGPMSKSYLILGIACLLSLVLCVSLWAGLAAKLSVGAAWKVVSVGFVSSPYLPLLFVLGMVLLLWGMASVGRPFLQLHEYYFTLRPHWFSRRAYHLYREIDEVDEFAEHAFAVKVASGSSNRSFRLTFEPGDKRKRLQLLNAFRTRRDQQQRMVFAKK